MRATKLLSLSGLTLISARWWARWPWRAARFRPEKGAGFPEVSGVRRVPPFSKARECRALQTARAVRLRPLAHRT